MKNLFKSLMLVAVAAMAFTACQKDNGEVNAVAKKTVINFTAGFDADTRSYFGDKVGESYPSFWEGGEQVKFVAPAADYDGTYTAYAQAVKLDDEGKSATFTVVFNNPITAGTVKAYLGEYWNTWEDSAYVDEYYTQTPRANSVDPRFHLASTSFEYNGESLDFAGKFEHGVAYGKMTVKGFEGKKISGVTIELFKNEGEGMYQNSKRYRLNTAELDTQTYWFAAEACEAKKFTVSVVADGVTYVKSVELTAEQPLNFNVGRVSTFSVSNLALPLDTPIINASFADGKVTATWDAIENAVAYKVEVNGEVVEEAYKETSYTFNAEYNTQYEIAVTALAEENSVEYSDSDKGSTNYTTPMDINMVTDYEVTLKSYTFVGETSYGLTYKFTGDTDKDWIEIPFNPYIEGDLPAGTYTGVYGSWSFSQTSALEYNWYDASFNLADSPAPSNVYYCGSAGLVVVERENNSFKVTAIVSAYIGGSNKMVKYVYEETNEEPAEPDGIVFTSSLLEASSGFGDFYITFSDNAGLKLRFNFYNCQDADKNFLPEGTYNVQSAAGGIFANATYTYAEKDETKYGISGGAVVVSEVNGVYKFEVDIVVDNLGEIKGTYEGEIEGLVVPSEYVEPEPEQPTDITELTIVDHYTMYSGPSEHELCFIYDSVNSYFVDIDFAMNPVTAGTYTMESGLIANYCKYEWQLMKSCTAIVTDNGDGTLTFDATFQAASGKWYHFTYTAQIYS